MAEQFEARASLRYLPMSPQKVRLVVDMVRGLAVTEALNVLQFTPKTAAKPVRKLLSSAVANAEQNLGLNRDDLFVSKIFVDKAPTRPWRRFGARGRFKPIKRRHAHVTVILRERDIEPV